MVCSFCHDTPVMSCQDADANVQALFPVGASRIPPLSGWQKPPVRFGYPFSVELIGRIVHVAEIAQAIVHAVAVDVVNKICLLTVGKEPANAMRKVCDAIIGDAVVTVARFATSRTAGIAALSFDLPNQVAR